jgi:hypothetical protein
MVEQLDENCATDPKFKGSNLATCGTERKLWKKIISIWAYFILILTEKKALSTLL